MARLSDGSWGRILTEAQQHPEIVQGEAADAHLRLGIAAPLALAWEKAAFMGLRRAILGVSPTQYCCKIEAGALLPHIGGHAPWDACDTLLSALSDLQQWLHQTPGWPPSVREPGYSTGSFASLLYLARRGVLGIRTSPGLWCQSYECGWPKSPPFLIEQHDTLVGLVVAAALNPQHCPGLPYTLESVEAAIPKAARPYVTVQWRPEDDIFPEPRLDPRCILRPENIHAWL